MSGTLLIDLEDLRDAINAEETRLAKRPVPTAPWAMPLDLNDLRAFIEVVDVAFWVDDITPLHSYEDGSAATALRAALTKFVAPGPPSGERDAGPQDV